MFENMTFENILSRCLARVSSNVDKREGSVIYDAIAPAAAELAILYTELDTVMDRAFPDTATDVDLTKKAEERSVLRRPATPAVRRGYFENAAGGGFDVPIGSRYSGGDMNFVAIQRTAPGQFSLRAETPGEGGNTYFGTLFPIDYIEGLAAARIADVLIPGEDEESDDELRERYYESLKSQAFGGNQADYKEKTGALPGVGGVKVIPVWNGGGTVKVIITDSAGGVPAPELIDSVQTALDPTQNQGEGMGTAPIGHVVTVAAASGVTINVYFVLVFESGVTWASVEQAVRDAIQAYFGALTETWAESDGLIVRVSQVEAAVLNVPGVVDIQNTTINGGTSNIALAEDAIPILGVVTNGAA